MVTWGYGRYGGDSSGVDFSGGVDAIFSSNTVFASIKSDGSVVTWGESTRGGNSSGGDGGEPVNPQNWSSWTVPNDPAPFEFVTVFVDVEQPGVTVTYSVLGTDGYQDSDSLISNFSGTIYFDIPGGEAGVSDTVTVEVPEWGSNFSRTWIYTF